jgi:hypothetical protein
MFIPDPDFYSSRIPDPKTATKERDEKKFVVINFFCRHKFHKIKNYFTSEMLKKIWGNFQRILELFTHKIATKLSKIWVWGSEIRKKTYTGSDHGVKKAPDPGSGPQHCCFASRSASRLSG